MRSVLIGDVMAAARAVLAVAAEARPDRARDLIRCAHAADCIRKRGLCPGPLGNGSLAAAALAGPTYEGALLDDVEGLSALIEVLAALRERRQQGVGRGSPSAL